MADTVRKRGVRQVALSEVKDDLSRFLREAEKQEIVITRRGRPVARLISTEPGFDRNKARKAVAGILQASRGVTLGGLDIKDLIGEGRP